MENDSVPLESAEDSATFMNGATETACVSELEKNAVSRAERLKQIRAQMQAKQQQYQLNANTEDSSAAVIEPMTIDEAEKEAGSLVFRSYNPSCIPDARRRNGTGEEDRFNVVERNIEDIIEDTQNTAIMKDELDLEILAPKKADWDLRRTIQSKLDLLNRKTEKSISQLIKMRLQEGDSQLLPAAINSALRAQQTQGQFEEEEDEERNDSDGGNESD